MGVFFLITSPVHIHVVVVGVLCLATSPARVHVVVVGVLCLATSPAQVHVGEPVVPCFLMVGLLLRASTYDFMALATSTSLVVIDIELCMEVCEEVLKVGCHGFVGI